MNTVKETHWLLKLWHTNQEVSHPESSGWIVPIHRIKRIASISDVTCPSPTNHVIVLVWGVGDVAAVSSPPCRHAHGNTCSITQASNKIVRWLAFEMDHHVGKHDRDENSLRSESAACK